MRYLLGATMAALLVFAAPANAHPKVRFSWKPRHPVVGRAVVLDASHTRCDHRPCSFTWRNGVTKRRLGTGRRSRHKFATPGRKRVRLTVRNARHRRASRVHTIVVRARAAAAPAARIAPPSTAAAAPSTSCMLKPSACGYPDMTNTGVLPGVARQAVSGTVTLGTPGQVYENKTLTGGIIVTAPNVTIRNVKILNRNYQAIRGRLQQGNPSGLRIENVEIDLQGVEDSYGIVEDGYTAVRTLIHNGSDCAHLGTNASITDSFCSVGPDANNDGWADSLSFCSGSEHFDGYSSDGGSNQVYNHNTIRNPCGQTSAILISTNSGPISNVWIANNLMTGGGWTLYCSAGPAVGGYEVVVGNRFARTYHRNSGGYGPAAYCKGVRYWAANVWDDNLQPIPR
jgi:hypothetical protein